MPEWSVREEDHEFYRTEIESFLPARIFDAHIHLYRRSDFHGAVSKLIESGPSVADWSCYRNCMEELLGDRDIAALAFPLPVSAVDVPSANAFLVSEAAANPECLGQMLIAPDMDPEFIRETVRQSGLVGLKCYHIFSGTQPTFESAPEDYLPENHVRIAHEEGLTITLHLVRTRALADPVNIEAISRLAGKYPNSRWILAHAGRGFNVHHTMAGISGLRGLRNVWFDTSAITESGAFEAIVKTMGSERLLYGSDFPVSHIRGRCVAIGDSFLWLTEDNTDFSAAHGSVRPVLILLESLRALKQAVWNLGLTDTEVEAIFHTNALDLFDRRLR